MRFLTVLVFSILTTPGALLAQRTIYVDVSNPNCPGTGTASDPFCEIQSGIVAAHQTDTVLVQPGTYRERIDFLGKRITVRSAKGPGETIIDGYDVRWQSTVTFKSGERKDTVLQGFTVENGMGSPPPWGSPYYYGGGIFCVGSSPTIVEMIVRRNFALFGGGLCCFGGASPLVRSCLFYENRAVNNGGGAVAISNCRPTFESCVFRANSCGHTGGGMNFRDSKPVIRNCTFERNHAKDMGGGIRAGSRSDGTITGCTFFGNTSDVGGGLAVGSDTSGYIGRIDATNSIFWSNSAPSGPQISLNGLWPAEIHLSHCDVAGGQGQIYQSITNNSSASVLQWGAGMLSVDPRFVDSSVGDFHILHHSPCRDSGLNSAPSLALTDFEGDPRIAAGTVDIGVDEFFPHLYQDATNAQPGGVVVIKILGAPSQVAFWCLAKRFAPGGPVAVPGLQGMFFLDPNAIECLGPLPIPASGLVELRLPIPLGAPKQLLPMQALVGAQLTNPAFTGVW